MADKNVDSEIFEETETVAEVKTEEPPIYRVLLHNDDYTTMEFVVKVLKEIFHKNEEEAINIMLHVHHNGMGIAGIYTKEIAEIKMYLTTEIARENGFPLLVTMEKENT
jgi:ATP-dependent Clp protease adaptor protein ClpS